jgi:hypothetical protein
LIAVFFTFPVHAKYSGGSGTAQDPYQIATAADLIAFGETSADYDKHFILTADIDLDPNLPGRKVFDKAVIAPAGSSFTGLFDGKGHTILRLTIEGDRLLGLFGSLQSGAEVKNLGVVDVNITGSGQSVGGLVGYIEMGAVTGCYSSGSVSGPGSGVGGLVGDNWGSIAASYSSSEVNNSASGGVEGERAGGLVGSNSGSIVASYSTGSVSGSGSVGGLVGANGGSIAMSYNSGSVSGAGGGMKPAVGGLVANNWGSIAASYNSGPVSGMDDVGGLVGHNDGRITTSYSTGSVSGMDDVGGLVGVNDDGSIATSYSSGSVSGTNHVGGLVGFNAGSIATSYSTGLVSGKSGVGGLVGSGSADSVITSFWDIETSGQVTSAGGTGKTTAEMQTASTFLDAGWDFVGETANGTEDIWGILEGQDYPRPVWRAFSPSPCDGAEGTVGSPLLSWCRAITATGHDVYFGENEDVVANATTATPGVYRGWQPAEAESFDPGILDWGKTYYWRIDEVNPDEPGSPWKGEVWRFSTSDVPIVSVIDDFEGYTDNTDAEETIWQSWIDGLTNQASGSQVGYDFSPFAEKTIVHGGKQSMPFAYDNTKSPFYSEAEREFDPVQNWTGNGANELTLWVRGYPAMTTVAVTETAGKIDLTGAGADIWGNSDEFTYAYKTLIGDGSMVARVVSNGTGSNSWAKGGVMIRDSLNGGSTHAMMVMTAHTTAATAGNGASFQYRMIADGTSGKTESTQAVAPPYWVKIERSGDTLKGSVSADGKTWTTIGTTAIAMTDPVYIGLCVASHAAGEDRTFQFDNISTTGNVTGAWQGAVVNSPQYNAVTNMYLTVQDSAGKTATATNPTAVTVADWTYWKTPLSEFTSADVKMTAVKTITIGVGDHTNPQPGGTGRIYIDDIRLTKRTP